MPIPRWLPRVALVLLAVTACSSDEPTAPLAYGRITGSVTVLGNPLPDGPTTSARVYLFRTPDASKADAVRQAPLGGGPRDFQFVVDSVPPGTYYLEACLAFAAGAGCAPYTREAGGNASPIGVQAGATVDVTVDF